MRRSSPATLVISRALRPAKAEAFARWTDDMGASAKEADGYAGLVRLEQTDGLQHLLLRFTSEEALQRFRDGNGYRVLEARGDALSVGIAQMAVGRDVHAALPSDASASPWKRFVVTWLSVLPVLLVVSSIVRLMLPTMPPPLQIVISSLLLTALLQWLILPRVQRAARAWMLKDASGTLRVEA